MIQNNPKLSSYIKAMLQQYGSNLESVCDELKRQWRASSPKRDSGSETMYALGKQDGMCEGIDTLMQELERIASEH